MFTRKCILNNKPCDTHKEGKYLKWPCGNQYSAKDRRKRYVNHKINCENCGKSCTKKYCIKCRGKFFASHLLGKKLPKWWCEKISDGQKKQEESPFWKGETGTYSTKHKWIVLKYGNPKECQECGKTGIRKNGKWTIEWANISGFYKRDIKDYKKLCKKCHCQFDGITKSIDDYKHGSISRYVKGCRCELCKEAKRINRKLYE